MIVPGSRNIYLTDPKHISERIELATSLKRSFKKKEKSESNFYLLFRPDDIRDSARLGALLFDKGRELIRASNDYCLG